MFTIKKTIALYSYRNIAQKKEKNSFLIKIVPN